jgi:hypothetical protein
MDGIDRRQSNRNPRLTIPGILLLSATIYPRSTIFVQRSDPITRLTDYQIALRHWLAEPSIDRIIFCENSGADLDPLRLIASGQNAQGKAVEFISYTAPEAEGARGKGYGELGILSHVLSHRALSGAEHILKVTGRYTIDNFNSVVADIRRHEKADIITPAVHLQKLIPSECFYATVAFIGRYLLPKRDLINDAEGFYFEHALAKAVAEAIQDDAAHIEFTNSPRITGISGTTNLPRGIQSSSIGVEIALTLDYLAFIQIALTEFIQRNHNTLGEEECQNASQLLAKISNELSTNTYAAPTNVLFTYDELSVLRGAIESGLCEPTDFGVRTGVSIETATMLVAAIGEALEASPSAS